MVDNKGGGGTKGARGNNANRAEYLSFITTKGETKRGLGENLVEKGGERRSEEVSEEGVVVR